MIQFGILFLLSKKRGPLIDMVKRENVIHFSFLWFTISVAWSTKK